MVVNDSWGVEKNYLRYCFADKFIFCSVAVRAVRVVTSQYR